MKDLGSSWTTDDENVFRIVWALFCVVFLVCAVVLQMRSGEPPQKSQWYEELFEILTSLAGLTALILHYRNTLRTAAIARLPAPSIRS